ncbi:MAG: tRNA (N6-threonylcarbamoyladenosine(37)-N6)-methyltransferase TrmO [Phycisphaerae bacterium]|nr:tRNA (N6-threonylcarbamoyladenosine(37)-N6)-methyltransferase TrmO [Phycisphaerae bacterium]
MTKLELQAIGTIHSPWTQTGGMPIQPRYAQDAEGTVEVFASFVPGLKDLEGFERVWLLYWFHQAKESRIQVKPFKDDTVRGLFATRAPCRPNPIGLSSVRLLGVEGNRLRVADVDILDGTPLLDIKPYVPEFDHFDIQRIGWLATASGRTMSDHRFGDTKEKS